MKFVQITIYLIIERKREKKKRLVRSPTRLARNEERENKTHYVKLFKDIAPINLDEISH